MVEKAEPVIEYVLSCHGNQNRYIVDRYKEFAAFVRKKTEGGFHITKDAGVLLHENDSKTGYYKHIFCEKC